MNNGNNLSTSDSTTTSGYLKREQLVGKSVIASNAELIGTVKDIAATIDGKLGLNVMRKSSSGTGSEEVIINADEIQAMGDVVLLKPKGPSRGQPAPPPFPTATTQAKTCGRCAYVNGATSKFCIRCGATLQ